VTALVAGGLAAVAVLAFMGLPDGARRATARRSAARRRRGVRAALGTCIAVAAVGILLAQSTAAVLDLVGLAALSAGVGWLVRRRRAEIVRRRRHDAVLGLCGALAAELHAGLPTQTALLRACAEWPEFSTVWHAARLGGDIAGELRVLARRPGAAGLRAIAAGWTVAAHSGGSLARVLDRLLVGLRDEDNARAEVEAALEAPRATARMLAVLPLFGVALGSAMGADPIGFLVHTGAGRLCLLAGMLLALAGVAWVEGLAATATR
jgi:tight adherence protein B